MKNLQEIHGSNFYFGDCIRLAQKYIPDDFIDLIITDPPYGIEGQNLHRHYNRDESHVVDGYIEVPAHEYLKFSIDWIKQAERILKPGGQIYIVSGYTNLYQILHALKQTSLQEINHIIWKYNFGVYTQKKYISSHYHILYYEKPGSSNRTFNLNSRFGPEERDEYGGSLNYQDREDVWQISREYKQGKQKNKNELPLELLIKMLQYSSCPGDLVCDMFMGGFSTARAALGLGRSFVGFERSETIYKAGIEKIKAITPTDLVPSLRTPEIEGRERQGQPWDESEKEAVIRRYCELRQNGITKAKAISSLCTEFQRGKFSITNILKKI